MKKKILKIGLTLSLAGSLIGCTKTTPQPTQTFDSFIKDVETYLIDGTTSLNMNFLMNDPISMGFENPTTYGIGFASEDQTKAMYDDFENFQDQLHAYDYETLDNVQKRTYDALNDYLSRNVVLKDYYYYDNDAIGSYSSVIQELPLLLEMYVFLDKSDLEAYFKDIAALKDDFINYANFEKERQDMGLGFSEDILVQTRSQIQDIIDEGGKEIIAEVNENIATLDFLTADEIASYQQQNVEAIQNDFINAYQTLLEALNEITGVKETLGLAHFKNGKDYYEAIIYHQLGIKDRIKTIEKRLEEAFQYNYAALQAFAISHSDLLNLQDFYGIQYQEFSNPSEGLDYLKSQIFEMVPEISDLNYRIYTVPDSLQEGFAPAAYLTGRIDMAEGQKESILINPKSTENILPTLVHEGYPGHMYQNTYLRQLNYPTIHYLLDCIGYTEGWAIYVENKADQFLTDENEAAWQKMLLLNENVTTPLLAMMDIGIHYHGWTYEDCTDYFYQQLGIRYGDELKNLYEIIIQTPGYYLYYIYAGIIMDDLHEKAKDELGQKFDEVTFNQSILDSGPVGLDVVRKNIEQYIDQK